MNWDEHMRTMAVEAREKTWTLQNWKAGPALFPKNKKDPSAKFIGQAYDNTKYELIEDGWDHEHCPFCSQSICDCGSENCDAQGFTDGTGWICRACHEKVIVQGKDTTPPRVVEPRKKE